MEQPAAARDTRCRICHAPITVPLRTPAIEETCERHAGEVTPPVGLIRDRMQAEAVASGIEAMATQASIDLLLLLRAEIEKLADRASLHQREERTGQGDRDVKAINLAKLAGQEAAYRYVVALLDNTQYDLRVLIGSRRPPAIES